MIMKITPQVSYGSILNILDTPFLLEQFFIYYLLVIK